VRGPKLEPSSLHLAAIFSFLAALLPGCTPVEPIGSLGSLHEGGFNYCDDPKCNNAGESFPKAIAVGASFYVWFDSSTSVYLQSTDESVLSSGVKDDDVFHALRAGNVNIEARTLQAQLFDYIPVQVAETAGVATRVCARSYVTVPEWTPPATACAARCSPGARPS